MVGKNHWYRLVKVKKEKNEISPRPGGRDLELGKALMKSMGEKKKKNN